MSFTVKELNEWYEGLDKSYYGPESTLPEDLQSPFGEIKWLGGERDVDYPSAYYEYIEIDGRTFRYYGSYDSWNGIEWEVGDNWVECVKETRVQEYWRDI